VPSGQGNLPLPSVYAIGKLSSKDFEKKAKSKVRASPLNTDMERIPMNYVRR
jgi:hypothetical protein